ncbi:MAG: M14 family zinc carboxypeptidase, partial [Phycisphaerales bacterium JB039]
MTHWPESGRLCAAGVVALGQLVGGCAAAGGPEEKPAPAPEPVWPAFTVTLGEQDGPVRVQRESIGPSAGGVEIPLYQLWVPGDAPPGERPAVLVIAGIDARHEVGHEVARDLIGALRLAEPAVLAQTTLYIVPMLNPDAQQRSGPLDAA